MRCAICAQLGFPSSSPSSFPSAPATPPTAGPAAGRRRAPVAEGTPSREMASLLALARKHTGQKQWAVAETLLTRGGVKLCVEGQVLLAQVYENLSKKGQAEGAYKAAAEASAGSRWAPLGVQMLTILISGLCSISFSDE